MESAFFYQRIWKSLRGGDIWPSLKERSGKNGLCRQGAVGGPGAALPAVPEDGEGGRGLGRRRRCGKARGQGGAWVLS